MKKFKRAKFGTRIVAALIDYILFYIVNALVGVMFYGTAYFSMFNFNATTTPAVITPISVYYNIVQVFIGIVAIAYYVFLPLKWEKQTIGRSIMNIRVVKVDDSECEVSDLAMREILGQILSGIAYAVCCIGIIVDIVFLSRDEPTTMRDEIAKTKIVDLNNPIKESTNVYHNVYAEARDAYVEPSNVDSEEEDDDDIFDFTDSSNDNK